MHLNNGQNIRTPSGVQDTINFFPNIVWGEKYPVPILYPFLLLTGPLAIPSTSQYSLKIHIIEGVLKSPTGRTKAHLCADIRIFHRIRLKN